MNSRSTNPPKHTKATVRQRVWQGRQANIIQTIDIIDYVWDKLFFPFIEGCVS